MQYVFIPYNNFPEAALSKHRRLFFVVFMAIVFLWQFLAYLSLLRLR